MITSEDVRASINAQPTFIEGHRPDADAAYQRLKLTRKMTKEYRTAINDTNTADVPDHLKELYADAFILLLEIISEEQRLIREGE